MTVLRPVDRYHSYIDLEGDIIQPISNVVAQFQLLSCYNSCHPFLMNVKINLCQFDGKSNSYYANMLHRMFLQAQTNIKVGICPYHVDSYYLKNLTLNTNAFKMFPIPYNTYKITLKFHINEGNKKIWIVTSFVKFQLYDENDSKKKHSNKGNNSTKL